MTELLVSEGRLYAEVARLQAELAELEGWSGARIRALEQSEHENLALLEKALQTAEALQSAAQRRGQSSPPPPMPADNSLTYDGGRGLSETSVSMDGSTMSMDGSTMNMDGSTMNESAFIVALRKKRGRRRPLGGLCGCAGVHSAPGHMKAVTSGTNILR